MRLAGNHHHRTPRARARPQLSLLSTRRHPRPRRGQEVNHLIHTIIHVFRFLRWTRNIQYMARRGPSSTPPDLVPLCIDWGLTHVFHVSGGYAVHLSRQQRRRSGCFLSHRTRSCSATGLTQAGIDDNSLELQTLLDEEYAPHATPVDLRMAGARPHWIGKGTPWSRKVPLAPKKAPRRGRSARTSCVGWP